jgi:predicted nucleic acid-binding protein
MSEDERSKTTQFLENHFTSATFGRTCARLAAAIRSTTKIKLPDAAIAATAMLADVPVVTRNIKDFKKIHGLRTIVL